jgi:predicted 2-oxoglutarate/Fe(II)-dependent dioxygenase YbiX
LTRHLDAEQVSRWLSVPRDKRFIPVQNKIEQYIPNNAMAKLPEELRKELLQFTNVLRTKHGYAPAKTVSGWIIEYNVGDGYPFHLDQPRREAHKTGGDYLALVTLLSDPKDFTGGELVFDSLGGAVKIEFPAAGWAAFYDGRTQQHALTCIKSGKRVAIVSWSS